MTKINPDKHSIVRATDSAHDLPDHTAAGQRPEWAPEDAGAEFATRVIPGVEGGHDGLPGGHITAPGVSSARRRRILSTEDYVNGVLAGDRAVLARAITLVESNAPAHATLAADVLRRLQPAGGNAIRVGITGVPGVGKSTFIEAFGELLCAQGHRIAVLAVDPTSSITRGSILGDKTRMERLARNPNAFIRPSPSGGTLGGVARKTRESMLVCEAAGFDIVLVETVGVGQSEISVRSMVDFFLLLMLAGAGDELQGIKKGIIELADALVITKADGDNRIRARAARAEYAHALRFLTPATEGWKIPVQTCSALDGSGIAELWALIEQFRKQTEASGVLAARRSAQAVEWMHAIVEEALRRRFLAHPAVQAALPELNRQVAEGTLPPGPAAEELLRRFDEF